MSESWDIYDRLLDEIPEDATVASCLVGRNWTLVDSGGMGLAMTYRGGSRGGALRPPHSGRPLRELATHLKSWNLYEASLGMAAVNSFHNAPDRLEGWLGRPLEEFRTPGIFVEMLDEIAGKKVAVVGHFPDMETAAERCTLTVLERNPQDNDLPDFAAEYVLADQDYVFITGTALTNKTLPRLLALCSQATVALVGPSVPLAPWWFDHGVDVLAGTVVVDRDQVWQYCQEGGLKGPFENGAWMVQITRDDLARRCGAPAASGAPARGRARRAAD